MALSSWRGTMVIMKSGAVRRAGGVAGLRKDEIRQIVLEKLRVVYDDWGFDGRPFEDFMATAGERRDDARAFLIALVAALVGGFSEAIARNNARLVETRRRQPRRRKQGATG